MTNPWKPTNRMTDDTVMHDAIGKIREASDLRREVEAHVLAENNLASVRQLSEDKKKKFCAIVDALLAEQEIDVQLFPENDQALIDAASQIKTTTWGTITESADLQELSPELLNRASTKAGERYNQAKEKMGAGHALTSLYKTQTQRIGAARDKAQSREGEKQFRSKTKVSPAMDRRAAMINAYRSRHEEAEDIQELSKGTVKSYHSKARKDVGQRVLRSHDQAQTDWKAASKDKTKVAKRLVGLNRASDRLNKEEIVDESVYGTVQKIKKGLNFGQREGRAQARSNVQHQKGLNATAAWDSKGAKKAYKNSDRYQAVADGKGMKFGTRKEEIMEAILEMEGLRIDQLTESGLEKLNAIAEQVMIDEGVELEEGAIGDIIRSHVRPIKQKWDAQSKELKRRSVHAFSKPGSWEHTFSHPNAMHNPGHDPEKHNYDGKSFTHHVHLHDTKGDVGNVSKFKVVARNDKDAVEAAKYEHSEFSDAHPHELKVVHIHHVMHEDLDEEKKKLNELSKATLSRYIVKAHTSGTAAAADQENAYLRGAKRNKDKLRKAGQTGEKREKGINRAAHQLSYKKEDTVEEGIKEKIGGMIRRRSTLTLGQTRRDYASGKQADALKDGKPRAAERYGKWIDKDRKRYGSHTPPRPNSTNEAYEPRGERDVGDAKQPRGVPNKNVDAATLADRKLVKKNGGRFPDNNSY